MKTRILFAAAGIALTAGTTHAQDSLANVSKASGDSIVAAAELSEAGVKVVVGAVALPIGALGMATESTGRAMREGSEDAWDSANGPLEISPETITAQPAPQVPYDTRRDDRGRDDRDTADTRDDDRSQ